MERHRWREQSWVPIMIATDFSVAVISATGERETFPFIQEPAACSAVPPAPLALARGFALYDEDTTTHALHMHL